MSHIVSVPIRIQRKAPFSIHSNEICPLTVSDGLEINAAFDNSISQSPTNTSRFLSAGFALTDLSFVIYLTPFYQAFSFESRDVASQVVVVPSDVNPTDTAAGQLS